MTTAKLFEVFITTYRTNRIAVVEATNIYNAYDKAFSLFPTVNYDQFIIVPTTTERVLQGTR
jgi:hypothetical protein